PSRYPPHLHDALPIWSMLTGPPLATHTSASRSAAANTSLVNGAICVTATSAPSNASITCRGVPLASSTPSTAPNGSTGHRNASCRNSARETCPATAERNSSALMNSSPAASMRTLLSFLPGALLYRGAPQQLVWACSYSVMRATLLALEDWGSNS